MSVQASDDRPIVVLGATGRTGRLTAGELVRLGRPLVLAARRPERLRRLVEGGRGQITAVTADARDADSLYSALRDAALLVNCAGPYGPIGSIPLRVALARRVPYVDVSGEQAYVTSVAALDGVAKEAGVPIFPGAGLFGGLAVVTAALACQSLSAPSAVTITHRLALVGALGASLGTKRSAAWASGQVGWEVVHSERWQIPFLRGSRAPWKGYRSLAIPGVESVLIPCALGLAPPPPPRPPTPSSSPGVPAERSTPTSSPAPPNESTLAAPPQEATSDLPAQPATSEAPIVWSTSAQRRRTELEPPSAGPGSTQGSDSGASPTLANVCVRIAVPTWLAYNAWLLASPLVVLAGLIPLPRPPVAPFTIHVRAIGHAEEAVAELRGSEPYAATAAGLALFAQRILDSPPPPGLRTAADLGDPHDLLSSLGPKLYHTLHAQSR